MIIHSSKIRVSYCPKKYLPHTTAPPPRWSAFPVARCSVRPELTAADLDRSAAFFVFASVTGVIHGVFPPVAFAGLHAERPVTAASFLPLPPVKHAQHRMPLLSSFALLLLCRHVNVNVNVQVQVHLYLHLPLPLLWEG